MSHGKDHQHPPSPTHLRVKALETALSRKGLLDASALDAIVDRYENRVGPQNGAAVVARAWTDAEFKSRLIDDATTAIAEFGFPALQGEHVQVVENTAALHNVIVCTLCSCYPWSLLGLPPAWYKSAQYRSRTVREPRAVLEEFGVRIGDDVEVRVWDSTSELRYLVLPARPAGTESMNETELAAIVTRNSMIGTQRKLSTEPVR